MTSHKWLICCARRELTHASPMSQRSIEVQSKDITMLPCSSKVPFIDHNVVVHDYFYCFYFIPLIAIPRVKYSWKIRKKTSTGTNCNAIITVIKSQGGGI